MIKRGQFALSIGKQRSAKTDEHVYRYEVERESKGIGQACLETLIDEQPSEIVQANEGDSLSIDRDGIQTIEQGYDEGAVRKQACEKKRRKN